MQVNHLAPFLLTNLLIDVLIASGAKVIGTSSIAARRFGHLDLDDLDNHKKYSANKAYGDAKLANVLFAKELHRRYHAQGISAVAFHPGNVATSFAAESTSWFRFVYHSPLKHLALISPDKGAGRLVWMVNGTPGTNWVSGEYYEKNKRARTHPQAGDAKLAREF
jgi:NAD(P)-dependent dehydrogenase (short-subunit alcohol dehydrogenase family)